MNVTLDAGDCRDVLRDMAEGGAQFDACITDPPYHLTSIVKRFGSPTAAPSRDGDVYARSSAGFMGKQWDGGDIAFRPETWRAVHDVLKPGAHLLAFGGTRTWHRMTCAIEDAGFEIRDCLMWLYGTGFPKSHNAGEGRGTALKPAWEPIIVARKPLIGTVAANVQAHGTGAINIDACRVPHAEVCRMMAPQAQPGGRIINQAGRFNAVLELKPEGRWPANVVHDGSDEVEAAFAAFGERPGQQGRVTGNEPTGNGFSGPVSFSGMRNRTSSAEPRGDTGTASRFFYCAKASAGDRAGSKHPTVKPVALIRWLAKLVTPPGGTILDPFAGSGTTLQAAIECGFGAAGIEREQEYAADIHRRMAALA